MTSKPVKERCFVIGSIGDTTNPDDPVRRHVERVRKELIDPALRRANDLIHADLEAVRSDMEHKARDIWQSVLHSILEDRLIIAVITFERPNVLYELGIAKSAARDVIILKDRRMDRHFDIYHLHMIDYEFDEANGEWHLLPIDELTNTIVETYRNEGKSTAFGDSRLTPLNRQNTSFRVYDRFQYYPYEEWGKMLNRGNKSIDFMGTTLFDLSKIDNDHFRYFDSDPDSSIPLIDFLLGKVVAGGIDVTITFMHEDNPALATMLKRRWQMLDVGLVTGGGAKSADRYLDQVREEIAWSTLRWEKVAARIASVDVDRHTFSALREADGRPLPPERSGTFRVVKVREGQIKYRMTLTDQEVITTPIFYRHGRNGTGPAIWAKQGTALYTTMRDELTYLKLVNTEREEGPSADPGSVESHSARGTE